MRLRHRRSPLLLLLVPSLAASVALASSSSNAARDARADTDIGAAAAFQLSTNSGSASGPGPGSSSGSGGATGTKKYDVGTKDAPVDGKDGRPHEGPFVGIENLRKDEGEEPKKDRAPLKDRPNDPTMVDGKKIPESNDGVMFDKDRPKPKEGTTGTTGGVSEKDKTRKAQEGKTGEKAENKPDPPKEAPPLPHSEEEKIIGSDKVGKTDKTRPPKSKTDGKTGEEVTGLEVSADHLRVRPPHAHTVLTLFVSRNPMTSPAKPTIKHPPYPTRRPRITSTSPRAPRAPRPARHRSRTRKKASSAPSTPSSSL